MDEELKKISKNNMNKMRISTKRKYKKEPIEILELKNTKTELKIY